MFELDDTQSGAYLYHKSHRGEFSLSSDSVISTFSAYKRTAHIIDQLRKSEVESFLQLARTIGGYMIWPSNKVNGKMTINGERGLNRKIADRIDLTLECIRRYYLGKDSPLYSAFIRYDSFFKLFNNFRGFVDFFLLHGLVSDNYKMVNFLTPFDNFQSNPVPEDLNSYIYYRNKTIAFIEDRNNRIKRLNLNL